METCVCYIRREGEPWTRGRKHHNDALTSFINIIPKVLKDYEPILITVPHVDGGDFVAHFTHIENNLYQYIDAYERKVEIMLCKPEFVAYINRVIDF